MKNLNIYKGIIMKRIAFFFVLSLIGICNLRAQQYPAFTHYHMNKFIYNPAAAGMDGFTTINLIAREQWVGFKGTPKTHMISIDSRILGDSYIMEKLNVRKNDNGKTRSGNTAWGAYFYSDLNGPIDRTGVNGSYAYHIDLGNAQLSFGMSLVFFQLKIQGEDLIVPDEQISDPLLTGSDQSIWITDANFGTYYTSENYYVGYSSVQLLNSTAQFGKKGSGEYKLNRNHNFIGGFNFYASNRIEIEPAFLLKLPETLRGQLDFSVKGTYDDKYWAGLNIRTGTALSFFGGIAIENLYIGYAFDYNFNTLMSNTYGSHEFSFSYRIGDSARRYKWLNSY